MELLKSFITIGLITLSANVSLAAEVGPCSADTYTPDLIKEAREESADLLEIKIQNRDGVYVGSLFASAGKKLFAHALYVCGEGDNYFYVNSDDIRQWASADAFDWKMVSAIRTNQPVDSDSIHHDEAMVSASVETLEVTEEFANVRMVFQAWNYSSEVATNGVLYFQIPLSQ